MKRRGKGENRTTPGLTKKRRAIVGPEFVADLQFFTETNARTASRLLKLVDECLRSPFQGTGKPEPLKYNLRGCWARRLTETDRMVYEVTDEFVEFLSARFHY